MRRLALVAGVAALAGCDLDLSDWSYSCEYSRDLSDQISATALTALLVDAEAGDLHVEGRDGINDVRVYARACSTDRRTRDDIDFELARNNGAARLVTYVPSRDNARLDIDVQVPADFTVDVIDGSGDITIRGVYEVFLEDGSGDIDVFDIWGDVLIYEDGSGDIYVDDIGGDLDIRRDYSGRIDYRNVRGGVYLP